MTDRQASDRLRSGVSVTFDLAVRRHQARAMGTPRDEQELDKIATHFQSLHDQEHQAHTDDYADRVETAEAEVSAERLRPAPRIKPPTWVVEPSPEHLMRKEAVRRVERAHADRLMEIDKAEARAVSELMEAIYKRTAVKDRAKDAFTQTVERRSGQDRRVGRQQTYD